MKTADLGTTSERPEPKRDAAGGGRIAVVIPAYQEAATIADVARRALRQLPWVIVVDDASRDETCGRLSGLPVTLLRNAARAGKAGALWRGMEHALARGASAVVTLDGDGQHCPEDIPALLSVHAAQPEHIVIAARLQGRHAAPPARRAANRFADFWISWACGYPIADSQCGFRLYPAAVLKGASVAHDAAHGFVFESEILIDAASRGVESVAVPVQALYPPAARRSHFRSGVDALRITRMVAWRLLRRGLYLHGLWRALRRPVCQVRGGYNAAGHARTATEQIENAAVEQRIAADAAGVRRRVAGR